MAKSEGGKIEQAWIGLNENERLEAFLKVASDDRPGKVIDMLGINGPQSEVDTLMEILREEVDLFSIEKVRSLVIIDDSEPGRINFRMPLMVRRIDLAADFGRQDFRFGLGFFQAHSATLERYYQMRDLLLPRASYWWELEGNPSLLPAPCIILRAEEEPGFSPVLSFDDILHGRDIKLNPPA